MAKITGDGKANQLLGSSANDVINGRGGNDYIYGGGGADRYIGGGGNDILDSADGDTKSDTILGGAGDDIVNANTGDKLDGGTGHDRFNLYIQNTTAGLNLNLAGLSGGGTMTFAGGTRITNFEEGAINFGTGNDVISTGGFKVALFGGGGDDKLTGGDIADTLGGGAGNDTIDGGAGSDTVSYIGVFAAVHVDLSIQNTAQDTGGGGLDVLKSIENLTGSGNDDVLIGDSAANSISGGGGADTLTGGGGADTFVFAFAGESYSVAPDLITDLTNTDTIDLSGIDADTTTAGDQAFTKVNHFTGHAGQLIIFKNGGVTVIQMDTNGDGSADEGIEVSGDHTGFTHFIM